MENRWAHFIDAVSDDMCYVRQARDRIIAESCTPDVASAAFCRIMLTVTVSSIELMLKSWSEKPNAPDMSLVLDGNMSNELRAKLLIEIISCHLDNWSSDNVRAIERFFAIRALRNNAVHFGSRNKRFIEANGFPCDPSQLTDIHWQLIEDCFGHVSALIAATGMRLRDRGN